MVSVGNQKNFQSFMQAMKERYSEGFTPDEAWFRAFVGALGSACVPARHEGLSREDLDLIEKCRQIDATTWFKVAQWGTKSKAIHWKVAGIVKTVGEYAIGGWERSPSAKQAKWALEAYKTAQSAGALPSGPDAA